MTLLLLLLSAVDGIVFFLLGFFWCFLAVWQVPVCGLCRALVEFPTVAVLIGLLVDDVVVAVVEIAFDRLVEAAGAVDCSVANAVALLLLLVVFSFFLHYLSLQWAR